VQCFTRILESDNLELNNTCSTINHNTHDSHNQSNKKPILNKQNKNTLTIFHQNICGLLTKQDELINSLTQTQPQIICISEHHLCDEELEGTTLHSYALGAKFCRRKHKCGGVCIFIQDNIHYTNINIDRHSNEKDIEICAIKLNILSCTINIMMVYRSPMGNVTYFLSNLETALNQIYTVIILII
jgi:hypothetical protein